MLTHWYSQIDRAKSVPEVVRVVRDFMATWTPDELALLPEECRPQRIRDEQDVETLHSLLVEQYRISRASGRELDALQRLTSFIVRTSIRLSEIVPRPSDSPGEDPGGPVKSAAARRRD
jgi:hypothetical protein